MTAPGLWQSLWLTLHKDVVIEWKSRARLNATVFFALMTLLMFSFAVGPHAALLREHAAGYFWLALFLASVLSLGESMRQEADNDALEGLRLLPIHAAGMFLGKALGNALFLFALGLLLTPIVLAMYDAHLVLSFGSLVTVLGLGTLAVSAPGTLFAGVAVQARARDVLLPLLLFPILVPGLLAAVTATSLVLSGDPMDQLGSWMRLLAGFDVIYWALCGLLFGRVIEE